MSKHPDSEIITALGGQSAVARLCKCKQPSVYAWTKHGIPTARRQYLELLRPDLFNGKARAVVSAEAS